MACRITDRVERTKRIGERLAVTAFALLCLTPRYADSSVQAFHRSFGPRSSLLVSSPTVQWEVWPSEGARVTSVNMEVNGQPVKATYNEALRRVEYQPESPLGAGEYKVACRVMVDNRLEVKKDWAFQVSQNAIAKLAPPNELQNEAVGVINQYRSSLRLDPVYQESRLNAASWAHVQYLVQNRRTGHYEKEGEPGFVGVTPGDRLEAFGYNGNSWECVTYGSGMIPESVRDLFHAPYHRIPFLQPGPTPIGSGYGSKRFAVKFGDSGQTGLSVSPAEGQENIPTTWDGIETPNPLRLHPGSGKIVGYPIVMGFFSSDEATLGYLSASLKKGNEDIPILVNSRETDDHLDNAIILIPSKPLDPNTTYHVSIEAKVNRKKVVTREWSFVTGAR